MAEKCSGALGNIRRISDGDLKSFFFMKNDRFRWISKNFQIVNRDFIDNRLVFKGELRISGLQQKVKMALLYCSMLYVIMAN